jgi:hypothetical protein
MVGNSGGKRAAGKSGGKNPTGKGGGKEPGVAGKRALGVELLLQRAAGAPDNILPRRGRYESVDGLLGQQV